MTIPERIEAFLDAKAFGVVGASAKPYKYGNKVLRCYLQNHRPVVPVNPHEKSIEGLDCVPSVLELPGQVSSISIITPPDVTEQVVARAIDKGIRNIWMQPGAESAQAIEACEQAGINVIADGSCLLVVLGYREH
ncbi:MAG: CoA-binding protein [Desulfuromonadales bacterium]